MSGNERALPTSFARTSKLVRYITVAYLVLVVYASLYPFSEWQAPAQEVPAFLTAPWPAYVTWTDLTLNVLAYLPVGLLFTLVLMPAMARWLSALIASGLGIGLSLAIESIQVFLPGRIPSNVDLLCNGVGAIGGACVASWLGARWLLSGDLYRLRERWFHRGAGVDICFLLIVLWLLTQLSAEMRLFANGDVRHLLPDVTGVAYSARAYAVTEAGVAALNFAGVALMLAVISRTVRGAAASLGLLTMLAIALKTLAAMALFVPGNPALWITPGAMSGLAIGVLVWAALVASPKPVQVACATTFIALGMALVNASPENPYLNATLQVWQYGHYASLNDLTRMLSSAWSFAAIAFLAYAGYKLR